MKVGGVLRSPMTIMMIATMGLMMFLPRMMASLDPEQLEVSPITVRRTRFNYMLCSDALPAREVLWCSSSGPARPACR